MKVLVTGGCGFIGSAFIRMLAREGGIEVVDVDGLTYAGDRERLSEVESGHSLFILDICDEEAMNLVFREERPDAVVHFAAESHVDRSIDGAGPFVRTNVLGTQVLLDCAVRYRVGRFVQISTDEVYGDLDFEAPASREEDRLAPSSPYSASKAAADLLAMSYSRTHGLDVVVTRCSNNYGPWQHPEKFIPVVAAALLSGRAVPVYGSGRNVRDWIHVDDHCRGILAALRSPPCGRGECKTYNFGGRCQVRNIELVEFACASLGVSFGSSVTFVADRPGHDRRYAIDCSKAERELGWRPERELPDGLGETLEWYRDNRRWWEQKVCGRLGTGSISRGG